MRNSDVRLETRDSESNRDELSNSNLQTQFSNLKSLRIAVDIDEVLCRTNDYFLEDFNSEHNTNFTRENITSYDYSSLDGFESKYVFEKVKTHVSEKLISYEISQDAITTLKKLKEIGHELFILTSRFDETEEDTKKWIFAHFGVSFFKEIIFTNGVINNSCKSDYCINKDFDILIEDAPHYAQKSSEKGIKVLLMDCPWNGDVVETKNLIRVKNWKEISEYFKV